jgi:hypothetical protein
LRKGRFRQLQLASDSNSELGIISIISIVSILLGGRDTLAHLEAEESRTGVWLMLTAQLEAEIEQATERIDKAREGNFSQEYKDSWIAANETHIRVCQDEIKALRRLFKVEPKA